MLSAMRITLAGVSVSLLLMVGVAEAQKPLGVFDPGAHPPAWAQFGTISDTVSDDRLREAAAISRARGFLWVLQLGYHENPTTPIYAHAMRVRARLEAAGLWPYVVANSVFEETYEHCELGAFEQYGLPAGSPDCMRAVRDGMGFQHAQAKAALGLPILWITTVAGHPSGTFRPVPPNTDFVAIDAYIPKGGTFDVNVAPIFAYAEQSVAGTGMRLVQIPPWFEADGWEAPTALDLKKYALWAERPLWFAVLGFTWQDRPQLSMRGLESLSVMRATVTALGVK
jgi:hypothetical protein